MAVSNSLKRSFTESILLTWTFESRSAKLMDIFFESFRSFKQNIMKMLRVTCQTHILHMQTLITLQTIQNYNAIRNRNK